MQFIHGLPKDFKVEYNTVIHKFDRYRDNLFNRDISIAKYRTELNTLFHIVGLEPTTVVLDFADISNEEGFILLNSALTKIDLCEYINIESIIAIFRDIDDYDNRNYKTLLLNNSVKACPNGVYLAKVKDMLDYEQS